MQVTLLFFAAARDVSGCSKQLVDLPNSVHDIGEFVSWLAQKYPGLLPFVPYLRIAQNEQFADLTSIIEPDDILAIIPPVSGG